MWRGAFAAIGVGLLASAGRADLEIFYDFPAYNAAVDSEHSLRINFNTDADGGPLMPTDADGDFYHDLDGGIFSADVAYSSPDLLPDPLSLRVNIDDVTPQIGPMGGFSGTLRWDYTRLHTATAFTGIDVDSNTESRRWT